MAESKLAHSWKLKVESSKLKAETLITPYSDFAVDTSLEILNDVQIVRLTRISSSILESFAQPSFFVNYVLGGQLCRGVLFTPDWNGKD